MSPAPDDAPAAPIAPPDPPPARFAAAVGMLLLAVFLLSLMGMLVKLLSDRYGAAELGAWRNMIGMIPSTIMLFLAADWRARGRPLKLRTWKLALLRGCFVTVAQFLYYLGLHHLEFATASTLTFTGPIFVTALGMVVLGTRVGPWRWFAVAVGFAGVVWIMQPGSDAFTLAALLPLGAAFGYACSSVTAPLLDREAPTALINLYSAAAAVVGALLLAVATDGMHWPADWADFGLILLMGCTGGLGVLALVSAYRLAPPPLVSPFEYTGILYALALGWLVFGEAPLERLFPGALLIVAAGLIIAWRERRKRGARGGAA